MAIVDTVSLSGGYVRHALGEQLADALKLDSNMSFNRNTLTSMVYNWLKDRRDDNQSLLNFDHVVKVTRRDPSEVATSLQDIANLAIEDSTGKVYFYTVFLALKPDGQANSVKAYPLHSIRQRAVLSAIAGALIMVDVYSASSEVLDMDKCLQLVDKLAMHPLAIPYFDFNFSTYRTALRFPGGVLVQRLKRYDSMYKGQSLRMIRITFAKVEMLAAVIAPSALGDHSWMLAEFGPWLDEIKDAIQSGLENAGWETEVTVTLVE